MHTLRTRLALTTPTHRLHRTIMTHYQDVLSSFTPEKKLHVQFPEHSPTVPSPFPSLQPALTRS